MGGIDDRIAAEQFVARTPLSFSQVRELGADSALRAAGAITSISEAGVRDGTIFYAVKRVGLVQVMNFVVHWEAGAETNTVRLVVGQYLTSQATFMFIPVGPRDAAGYPLLRSFVRAFRERLPVSVPVRSAPVEAAPPAAPPAYVAVAAPPAYAAPAAPPAFVPPAAPPVVPPAAPEPVVDRAAREVADASTPASRLHELATERPDLLVHVARHPNAYDGLLEWIVATGPTEAQAAARERRG